MEIKVRAAQASADEMVRRAERYFAAVDEGDVPGTLEVLSPDCVIQVLTDGARHDGHEAIGEMFRRRLGGVSVAWHGNFRHLCDPEQGWVTSRFDVRRTNADGRKVTMDNINFFEFDGLLIKRITIWMSGENTLV